jgi:hypothetical protein
MNALENTERIGNFDILMRINLKIISVLDNCKLFQKFILISFDSDLASLLRNYFIFA